jgi:sulfur-oxidizing protein SoxY
MAVADVNDIASPTYRQDISDKVWEENLRPGFFKDREINEGAGQDILEIKAPYLAEDGAVVPVSIHTKIPQTRDNYINKMHVIIDKNPLPLVGVFEFSPDAGRADLAMRVRVNDFSYIRVIAEMNNGDLYMTKSFIRSKGGCSAPPGKSLKESKKFLGKMKMQTIGDVEFGKPNLMQLKIRHPNITGMAPDDRTGVYPPPFYVTDMKIDFDDKMIMKAKMTFAISQDPSFRFYFVPEKEAEMKVEILDSKDNHFNSSYLIKL